MTEMIATNEHTQTDLFVYKIGKIQQDRYWIERPDGRMFQVNRDGKRVLEQLAKQISFSHISDELHIEEEAIAQLSERLGIQPNTKFTLIDETNECHLRADDEKEKKTPLFKQFLEQPFPWSTMFAVIISIVLMILFMKSTPLVFTFSLKDQWIIVATLTLSVIAHEMGHLFTMPRNQHISIHIHWSGPIPLLSISSNEAWKLPKWHRMKINCAGLFADLLVAGFAASLGLLFEHLSPWIWTFLFIHLLRMIFAILPLLPGDGYWVLVDLFDQPNLWSKAKKQLRQLKCSWLSCYAIVRIIFLTMIWLLYGYVIYTWAMIIISNSPKEALTLFLYPAPLFITLTLLHQLYMALSFIMKRFTLATKLE